MENRDRRHSDAASAGAAIIERGAWIANALRSKKRAPRRRPCARDDGPRLPSQAPVPSAFDSPVPPAASEKCATFAGPTPPP